jgi:hypothetical protein
MTAFNALALIFPALCAGLLALLVYLTSKPVARSAREQELRPVPVRAAARRRSR